MNEELKNTENMETQLEENQVNTSNEEQVVDKKEEASTWDKVAAGAGLGVMLGSVASFMATQAMASEEKPDEPEPDKPTENGGGEAEGEQPVWTDGGIAVAENVTDEMSFGEAFSTARAEVGSEGAFEWRGNVYATYTAEEWNAMTPEEKEEYNQHFRWHMHNTEATTQTAESATAENEVEVVVEGNSQEEATVEEAEVAEAIPEVEVLGVVHDNETGANIGGMIIDDQEVVVIDVPAGSEGGDGVFDYMAYDADGNGQFAENEIADISGAHLTVDDLTDNPYDTNSGDFAMEI